MNPEQARHLVTETFTQSFERARFLRFAQNILNRLDTKDDRQKVYRGAYVTQAFADKVNYYERLGSYTDPAGDRVDVLAVYLNRGTTLERGRTSLRNFAAHYLLKHDKASAVLAAFVSPDESDWRFSFVKLEYSLEQTDGGAVNTRKELTPARRYSFLVGKHEHSHTAQKQFLPLLENDRSDPSLADIEQAFDIERVTKEFFAGYKSLFERVRDAVAALLNKNRWSNDNKDGTLREDFAAKGIETDDFAKKLLGQIVFLYFLQKKGWFGVARGAAWGTGDKNYLRHLFDEREKYYVKAGSAGVPPARVRQHANDVHQTSTSDESATSFSRLRAHGRRDACAPVGAGNFFNDILEPLFYETLATERTDDFARLFGCKIPFLNGGLFEPFLGYDWVNTDILIPDALFSNDEPAGEGERGTGVLDVFDRYNFTVNEAEPLEKDVAVDPEMLGKVFENLLPENLRHKGGAYYTPRVIVNYMCQQSLINYLSTHLPEVERAGIETFIRIGDFQADYEAAGTKSQKNNFLPASISGNAKRIDKLLEEITVCDPAIGSGAFPVGMMQEIVRARLALASVQGMPERSAYNLKRHAIQSSLYGVDIDPGAVEIAKLRLWLSLIVDEEDRATIHALPNLDYKIMQGNSLLEEYAGVKLLDEELLARAFVDVEREIDALNKRLNEREREFMRVGAREGRRAGATIKLESEVSELKRQREQFYRRMDAPSEQATFQDLHSAAREKLAELKQLHKEFFDVSSAKRKRELRARLEQVEWEFMEATLAERGEREALRELAKRRRDNRKNYFLWKLHFVEVFGSKGGFDVVIGNPPYGFRDVLTKEDKLHFRKNLKIEFSSGDSAELFVKICFSKLVKDDSILTFIIPKKSLYGDAWEDVRVNYWKKYDLLFILDSGKSFENVLLEASAFSLKKSPKTSEVELAFLDKNEIKRFDKVLFEKIFVKSNTCQIYKVLYPDSIFNKIQKLSYNKPLVQGKLGLAIGVDFFSDSPTEHKLLKGIDIQRYFVRSHRYLKNSQNLNWDNVKGFLKPKVISQVIVAHIENPSPHLKLTACYDSDGIIITNTLTSFDISSEISNKFWLGYLNSTFLSWYAYNFVYARAIRTMHFYNFYIQQIPIPKVTEKQRLEVEQRVDHILAAKRDDSQADVRELEREIDRLVYQLYELTDEEISIIEKAR